jgi:hypothetical protein
VVVRRHFEQTVRQFGQISAGPKILQLITAYKATFVAREVVYGMGDGARVMQRL